MLNNCFIFSIIVSIVNTLALYLFVKRQSNDNSMNIDMGGNVNMNMGSNVNYINDLTISFFVTFAVCFLLKNVTNLGVKDASFKGGFNNISVLSGGKPPF